ncbi:hypothetical protein SISSUDRAFT_1007301, partial [Sistotremastrum suecicum HHB10207 ss-3]
MTTTYPVVVSDIAPTTTADHLKDFFTISSIDYVQGNKTATVHFEKASAAKTALMLHGGTLDGSHISVTSEAVHPDEDPTTHESEHDGPIEQSDKPRAGIAAEYLAKGYVLSDHVLQRAIDLDNKNGISKRFLTYWNSLDNTLGTKLIGENQTLSGKVSQHYGTAVSQARAVDEQRGISRQASDYYSKAISSPFGHRVHAFYTTTSKQVFDIHEEARRIAESHKAAQGGAPAPGAPPASSGPGEGLPDPSTQAAPTVV